VKPSGIEFPIYSFACKGVKCISSNSAFRNLKAPRSRLFQPCMLCSFYWILNSAVCIFIYFSPFYWISAPKIQWPIALVFSPYSATYRLMVDYKQQEKEEARRVAIFASRVAILYSRDARDRAVQYPRNKPRFILSFVVSRFSFYIFSRRPRYRFSTHIVLVRDPRIHFWFTVKSFSFFRLVKIQ
jgi:hypothetical protein